MKSGRNISMEDGGVNRGKRTDSAVKTVRVADAEKKRASGRAPANPREMKTSSVINLPEPKKKVPGVAPASKSKISPPEKIKDNQVSSSIKKLLPVYEAPGKVRKPDDARTKPTVKSISTKPTEGQAPSKHSLQAYDKNGRRRYIPVTTDKIKTGEAKSPQVKGEKGEYQASKPVPRKKTVPEERNMKTVEEEVAKTPPVDDKTGENECEQLVPILSPVREESNPVSIINSFISDYLEEESVNNRSGSKAKMDFLLPSLEEGIGNVFPVRSKRAVDNIPNCTIPEALSPDNSEFIIMLRRRNSEPYSQKSCVLYGGDPERTGPALPVGFNRDALENYLFWEPGPAHLNKPYWEVSLFKSNRSLSVIDTTASSGHQLAPIEQKSSLIVNGQFNKSISETIREASESPVDEIKTCLPDLNYCKAREGTFRALSFVTLMERGKGIPNELGFRNGAEEEGPSRRMPSRIISKSDHYKPPADLLVYVKSTKRLAALDGGEPDYENLVHKKLHKITKVRGERSETRPTFRQKSQILAVVSAVLLTTAIIFLFQILMKRPAYFNLTPPIPGLVRGC